MAVHPMLLKRMENGLATHCFKSVDRIAPAVK